MPATKILEDLFFIERGYLNGNHVVFSSKEPVLIDSGYVADFGETEKLINNLGVRISDVRLIVNTHCHCDHVGGNKAIQERSGCTVAMHRIGKHFIDSRDDWATWWRYYGQRAEFFDCTQALEDGDVIPVGPHDFRVIHTPGHSADGIVLYNGKEKILISSDSLWENDMAVMTLRVEGSRALFSMLESLDRISALDVTVAYPGHGKPFTDVKGAIEKARKKIASYLDCRDRVGEDLIKKIIVYTLLMERSIPEEMLFGKLLDTHWFRETVDLYFGGAYEGKYSEIMEGLLKRGIVLRREGCLFTTAKP